jgi:NitT/TauT family transport system permease protein
LANRNGLKGFFLFLIPIISLVAIWEAVYLMDIIKVLPSPAQASNRLVSLAMTQRDGIPLLLRHVGTSFYRICLGFSLAMLLGVPLGLLMGLNRYVNFLLKPLFSLLLPLPTLAWVPILLIVFGMGDITIVIAIFLGGFFSITYNTATGVRGIDRDLIRAANTMGANRLTMFTRILLPGSMVSVIAGLRLAVGYSWRALVGAEMLAAAGEGVGSFIFMARQFSAVDDMFAGLVIIMLAGFVMERFLIEPLEKRTVRRWGMTRD